MDDRELNELLQEWKAPDAPVHLQPPTPRSVLHWLVGGTIRVRVPVAAAVMLLLLTAGAGAAAMWPVRSASPAAVAPAGARPSGEIARYPLSGPLAGFDAVVAELNFAPGGGAPEHRHPGAIVGYVVDGRMRTAIDHQPDEIVAAGGTFFEPHGALHTQFSSADRDTPAKAVAFLVVPNGSPITAGP